ncbi:Hypothetical predicted protein [Paramuricea clavata]|uniref:DNA 3'-5' helicase n=1 Tax=Paramuricea clavata TaxID=317549 RepID=A0A6S7H5B1_PARCT|nr:Hypothetical predicted protein [Paramuricea clavata]
MRDQVSKLKESITIGIVNNKYDTCDSHETVASYDLKEIISIMPRIIFAHPESLVSDKRALKLLKAKKCQTCVSAIVVDEAHLVIDWEKFRPAYGKLGILANIFPHTPIVAMTATATYDMQCKIIESLGMNCPQIVKTNPDRPNIYFSCKKRGNSAEEKLAPILDNLVAELDSLGLNTPFTLVYGTLEVVSECFLYVSSKLGKNSIILLGHSAFLLTDFLTNIMPMFLNIKDMTLWMDSYQVTLS